MKSAFKGFVFSLLLTGLFLPGLVSAQNTVGGAGQSNAQTATPTVISLTNPLGSSIDTPQKLLGKVINSVLGVVGSLALLMFVFGGLVWMTSAGNQEKVKKGRDIIVWSAIGLVIIFVAYALVRVLLLSITA